MGSQNPEITQQPSIAHQAVNILREAYQKIQILEHMYPFELREEQSTEAIVLSEAMTAFVGANLDDVLDISTLPRSEDLNEAIKNWSESRVQRRLAELAISALTGDAQFKTAAILNGKTIHAKSYVQGFSEADKFHKNISKDNPAEVTAPFYTSNPRNGAIVLGQALRFYEVPLFDRKAPHSSISCIEVL